MPHCMRLSPASQRRHHRKQPSFWSMAIVVLAPWAAAFWCYQRFRESVIVSPTTAEARSAIDCTKGTHAPQHT
jgi:hypothetical protein